MKIILAATIVAMLICACRNKDIPDVSGIDVSLKVERYEQDLFSADTNNILASLQRLSAKYPQFNQDFIVQVLGLSRIDTSLAAQGQLRSFISAYRPIYDSVREKFAHIDDIGAEVKQGLRFVKYYFPSYVLPQKLITFVGPIEGYGNVLTAEGLAVGLQSYMGRDFFLYQTDIGREIYPPYISRRFEPQYIAVNCMKNIIDDLHPAEEGTRPLIDLIVEKGKRLYVLDRIMPSTPDTIKIGYSKRQLEGCYENEGKIWNYLLTNNLLLNQDPAIINAYVSEGPNTPEFGEGSPGFIGLFVGWQVVKKYMAAHGATSLKQLMEMNNGTIYEESKYRPK